MTVLLTFSITSLILLKCATQSHRCVQSYTKENDPAHLLQDHVTLKLPYNEITNIKFLHKLFTNLINTFKISQLVILF